MARPAPPALCARLSTAVTLRRPGHFASTKRDLGLCTGRCFLRFLVSSSGEGWRRLGETRVLVRRLSAPERRVFNFNEVQLISSFLHGSCLWCCIQKWLPSPRPPRCSSVLAPRSLTVLQFTFGSGIHFESALVTCVRSGPDSFFHVRMSICSSTSC